LEIVQYLHTNGCPWDAQVYAAAQGRGRCPVLEYLEAHGCPRG
jgi:hypothetical protein